MRGADRIALPLQLDHRQIVVIDSDEALDEVFADSDDRTLTRLDAADADIDDLRTDLQANLEILERRQRQASAMTRDDNEKLEALHETLVKVREDAAADDEHEPDKADAFRQNRKSPHLLVLRGYR